MILIAAMILALNPAHAEWDRTQIDFVAETRTVRNLEQVLPRRQAELLRLLDSNNYTVRGLAQAEIVRMGDKAHEMLCWGCRVDKPSISELCKLLLAKLFWCPACLGRGECLACVVDAEGYLNYCPNDCDHYGRCVECDGAGDIRYRRTGLWDDGDELFEEKDYFGKARLE